MRRRNPRRNHLNPQKDAPSYEERLYIITERCLDTLRFWVGRFQGNTNVLKPSLRQALERVRSTMHDWVVCEFDPDIGLPANHPLANLGLDEVRNLVRPNPTPPEDMLASPVRTASFATLKQVEDRIVWSLTKTLLWGLSTYFHDKGWSTKEVRELRDRAIEDTIDLCYEHMSLGEAGIPKAHQFSVQVIPDGTEEVLCAALTAALPEEDAPIGHVSDLDEWRQSLS